MLLCVHVYVRVTECMTAFLPQSFGPREDGGNGQKLKTQEHTDNTIQSRVGRGGGGGGGGLWWLVKGRHNTILHPHTSPSLVSFSLFLHLPLIQMPVEHTIN